MENESRFKGKKQSPGTAEWVAQRLTDSPKTAIGILLAWTHPKKVREVTEDLVDQIKELSDKDAVEVLNALSTPKQYIRGRRNQRQLDASVTISTIDDKRSFRIDALVDCGSTGSCIDHQFVKENGISTRTLPRPIPVYNADGSANNNGPITETVELFIKIRDHTE